jgi:hypothetical protein
MSATHRFRPTLAFASLLIAIAMASAACGGTTGSVAPSATPVATPTAAPTPSPTPVDVPAAFVRHVVAPNFSATAEITGDLAIGAVAGDISGDAVFSGPNSSVSLSITAGTLDQETESVTIGTSSWSRKAPGPWLEDPAKPASAPDASLGEMIRSIISVVDLGVETRGGRQLHHLRSSGGNAISGAAVGFGSADAKDPKFTLDFYATDDGTPAIMAIAGTWTQVSGDVEVPSSMTFDIAFDDIGDPQVINPPDDVWVRHTSTALGYTMAHPADWTVESTKEEDSYRLNGQPYVFVAVTPFKGSTAKFVSALKASYAKPFGGDPASEAPTALGGQAAVRLIYQYKNDQDVDVTIADDVMSRDGSGWEVFLATDGGPEDIEVFDTFVATFAFVD